MAKLIRQDPTSAKVNKPDVDSFPPFRFILSTTDTLSYNLAKFLVPVLSHVTEDKFTVHDSFLFSKEIIGSSSDGLKASVDVENLFTNILLEETVTV